LRRALAAGIDPIMASVRLVVPDRDARALAASVATPPELTHEVAACR